MDDAQKWQDASEHVVKAVVTILFYRPRPFDTEEACCSEATGFVVDAKRGIICTNRHVAGPGPFRGRCLFHNQEEVDVRVLYYDPIHDYGFLKFDPDALTSTTIITELSLRPDLATIGSKIRVIGNDSAQRLTICEGIISRTNRNAPEYHGYRDFNINYIQGSAMTSGGSSGSPVVNIDGHAVALNAGSFSNASVAVFLPLEHLCRAFKYLCNEEPVPRGSLHVKWTLQAFHECRALGLPDTWINKIKQQSPDETSMLVVKTVLPGGPADSILEEGDVMLKINDKVITRFNEVTEILDSNVSKSIRITVQRWQEEIEIVVIVDDLHAITPNKYFMIGKTIFQDLSYQQATRYRIPVRDSGVLCSRDGFFGYAPGGSLIQSVNGKETKNLDQFVEVIQSIPDGTLVLVAAKAFSDIGKLEYNTSTLDRRLSQMELATQDFNNGEWTFTDIPLSPTPNSTIVQKAVIPEPVHPKWPAAAYIINSFVWIYAYNPLPVDGATEACYYGYGLVLNEKLGFVLVSRDVIRTGFCTITIQMFAFIVVPGEVVFVHPSLNYAILKYDPSRVDAPVKSAKLSENEIKPGDSALFFRCNNSWKLDLSQASVAGSYLISRSPDMDTAENSVNMRVLSVASKSSSGNIGASGLMSEDGVVQALCNKHNCITVNSVIPVLKQLENGEVPLFRLLGARFRNVELMGAVTRGISEEWLRKIENADSREVFEVTKPYAGHASGLEEGDVILELDGELVTEPSSLFNAEIAPSMQATILRDRQIVKTVLSTFPTEKIETSRFILFCGAVIQQPYLAVRQRVRTLHSDVFIAGMIRGSPMERFGVDSMTFITHVNNTPTPNLDAFLEQVHQIEDNKYFRLTGMTATSIQFVETLRRDEHYFPMTEYRKDNKEASGWNTIRL